MLSQVKALICKILNSTRVPFGIIGLAFIISILLHWHAFNLDLVSIHVWRQTETQTVINNFYKEDFNILNPRINCRGDGDGIFRKEFPIMQWLFACFYKLLGDQIAISRILSLLISFLSIIGIYRLIFSLSKNTRMATIGAWCFSFSPSFFYYSICPMPDNFALCTSIWGLAYFVEYGNQNKKRLLILSAIFLSLGTLAKLPFVLFYSIPLLFNFIQFSKDKKWIRIIDNLVYLGFAIPFLIWYYKVIPTWNGNGITTGIITNSTSNSELIHFLFSNVVSVLPELLLNYGSVFLFLAGLFFTVKKLPKRNNFLFPFILCLFLLMTYFLFELNMIEDKHDYYLFPFLPFLFIIVAYGANALYESSKQALKFIVVVSLLILPFTTFLRMKSRWNTDSPGFNKDLLVYKCELRTLVPNNDLVIAGNDFSPFIFLYYIDKKGWYFNNDQLDEKILKEMINKGAKYLYTDSKVIQSKEELKPNIEREIFNEGSLIVYKLKP